MAPRNHSKRRRIDADDLLRFRFVGDPRISPDGERILFTRKHVGDKNNYVTNLWQAFTDGRDPQQLTQGGTDSHGRWSPDGRLIAFIRSGASGNPQIHMLDTAGGEAEAVTRFPEGAIRDFKWSPDGHRLAVSFRETADEWKATAKQARESAGQTDPPLIVESAYYREDGDGYFGGQRFELHVVDIETGFNSRVFKDVLGGFSYDWSPDSKELAVAANLDKKAWRNPGATSIYRVSLRSGKVREVPNLPFGPKDRVQWSPNGKYLAYAGREGADDLYSPDNLHLFVCDPSKGNARSLTGGTDYCLLSVALTDTSAAIFGPNFVWAPNSRRLLAQVGSNGESHVVSVPRGRGEVESLTRGKVVHILGDVSTDGKRVALLQGAFNRLDEVYLGDLDDESIDLTQLTDFNGPLLAQLEIAKLQSHWVRSADGNKVQVWSMLPPRKTRGRCPAVLEIHGGPHAQYGIGFFHEFQVLAAKGYAVFFSNPRGSKGYGQEYCAAIRGSWGKADWTDIEAVAEFMQQHARVDPKRMGVMGGSYGGYMTNWAIGHTKAFRGAITDRCVSNLVSMSGNSDYIQVPESYWKGNPWDRPESLWEGSPLKYLGKCRTPTLIIHSEGDLRCNIEQAEQVHSALLLRNVPTRFVRYPRSTSHGMSRGGPPDMRIHRLGEILDWWDQYLS